MALALPWNSKENTCSIQGAIGCLCSGKLSFSHISPKCHFTMTVMGAEIPHACRQMAQPGEKCQSCGCWGRQVAPRVSVQCPALLDAGAAWTRAVTLPQSLQWSVREVPEEQQRRTRLQWATDLTHQICITKQSEMRHLKEEEETTVCLFWSRMGEGASFFAFFETAKLEEGVSVTVLRWHVV